MQHPSEPLSTSILAIMYFGDVVFAVSGALTAAQFRMDILGFVMAGTVTGTGGGTTRDLLLGRTVWWTQDPTELILCVVASLITFFFIRHDISHRKGMIWADALGLSVFGVVGCHVALGFNAPFVIAVFMGMVTATGGGVIRDVLTNTQPMIISSGQSCHCEFIACRFSIPPNHVTAAQTIGQCTGAHIAEFGRMVADRSGARRDIAFLYGV